MADCEGFLSIQAQDFIEEGRAIRATPGLVIFLSIQAQDFIEEFPDTMRPERALIPEHSSSGLH